MPPRKKKKKYRWEDLIPSLKKEPPAKPYFSGGTKQRGAEVMRTETWHLSGAIRRITIYYEYGDAEIIEYCGEIRIT